MTTRQPRIIVWDLESTNLNANFGYLLCFGYKVLGVDKKAKVLSISDYDLFKKDCTNDRELVKEAREILFSGDMWVTHYGSRFDIPLFNTRLIHHKMPILPPAMPSVDTWRIAKYKMKLNSNRLATISEFLETTEEKTPLSGPIWIRAAAGHVPSIRYIKGHCEKDVEVLEQVYEKIKPLCTTHPNVSLMAGTANACPTCGSFKIQRRGFHITRARKYQRIQCQNCGAWSNEGRSTAGACIR